MPAMMRVAPAPGRVLHGSRAMLALGLAMLLPACSPADEEAERGNGTAPAPEASRPADAVISPTAAGAGVAEQVAAKRRTLIAEAVEALQETESALGLLAAGKTDEARSALRAQPANWKSFLRLTRTSRLRQSMSRPPYMM